MLGIYPISIAVKKGRKNCKKDTAIGRNVIYLMLMSMSGRRNSILTIAVFPCIQFVKPLTNKKKLALIVAKKIEILGLDI
jgi:hypothetical protein